jgi:FixJ family two-component response regulator
MVYLVHKHFRFRRTFSTLLASSHVEVVSFISRADCLANGKLREADCLVLDLQFYDSGGANLRQ